MIELAILPPLVACEINVLLGAFALMRDRRDPEHLYFAAFALAAGACCLGAALHAVDLPSAHLAGRLFLFVGLSLAPAFYAAYCRRVAGRPVRRRAAVVFGGMWLVALGGAIAANLSRSAHAMLVAPRSGSVASLQVILVAAYLVGLYLAGFLALRPALHGALGEARRSEARFLFFGAVVPMVVVGAAAFPATLAPRLFPEATVFLAVMVSAEMMLYHGVRFKKVAIEEVLSRGLLYVIYTVLLTGALFFVLFGLHRLLGLEVTIDQLLGLVAACLAFSYLFMATRERLQRWIDQKLFPERTAYQALIGRYEEDLKEARERLHRAERMAMVGELSARIAHEIKNPLGPIKGYAQMLKEARRRGPVPEAALDKALDIIAEEADRIDERVRKFLDLSRRDQLHRAPTDLRPLIEKTIALLAPKDRVKISIDFPADPIVLPLDPAQFQGALYNLFINAIQAMDGNGELMIKVKAGAAEVEVIVADTGPGVAEDIRPRLFEPFVTGKAEGSGLGLAIVKSIVESHSGKISYENGGPGAVFKILLPV